MSKVTCLPRIAVNVSLLLMLGAATTCCFWFGLDAQRLSSVLGHNDERLATPSSLMSSSLDDQRGRILRVEPVWDTEHESELRNKPLAPLTLSNEATTSRLNTYLSRWSSWTSTSSTSTSSRRMLLRIVYERRLEEDSEGTETIEDLEEGEEGEELAVSVSFEDICKYYASAS
jgi:hypothetical protein